MWYRTDGGPVKCDFSRLTELPGLLTLRILEGITHVKHALSLRSERVVIGHEQKTPIWWSQIFACMLRLPRHQNFYWHISARRACAKSILPSSWQHSAGTVHTQRHQNRSVTGPPSVPKTFAPVGSWRWFATCRKSPKGMPRCGMSKKWILALEFCWHDVCMLRALWLICHVNKDMTHVLNTKISQS